MKFTVGIAAALALTVAHGAAAREYFIGGYLHDPDIQIYANYLYGAELALPPPTMPKGADVIHLEADIHSTGNDVHGFADGAWIPYLTVQYTMEQRGTGWRTAGLLMPMTAKDGPHYGNSVKMNGPGEYHLVFRITPPDVNGFTRHTDLLTGVPEFWKPFDVDFQFTYPQK